YALGSHLPATGDSRRGHSESCDRTYTCLSRNSGTLRVPDRIWSNVRTDLEPVFTTSPAIARWFFIPGFSFNNQAVEIDVSAPGLGAAISAHANLHHMSSRLEAAELDAALPLDLLAEKVDRFAARAIDRHFGDPAIRRTGENPVHGLSLKCEADFS